MGTVSTMHNHARGDLACTEDLINVVDALLVVCERVGIDLNLSAWVSRAQVDKGAVIFHVPGWITAVLGYETEERQLAIVIVVEKIPVDTHAVVEQGTNRYRCEVWQRGEIAGSNSQK